MRAFYAGRGMKGARHLVEPLRQHIRDAAAPSPARLAGRGLSQALGFPLNKAHKARLRAAAASGLLHLLLVLELRSPPDAQRSQACSRRRSRGLIPPRSRRWWPQALVIITTIWSDSSTASSTSWSP